jgi:hypothetical protein
LVKFLTVRGAASLFATSKTTICHSSRSRGCSAIPRSVHSTMPSNGGLEPRPGERDVSHPCWHPLRSDKQALFAGEAADRASVFEVEGLVPWYRASSPEKSAPAPFLDGWGGRHFVHIGMRDSARWDAGEFPSTTSQAAYLIDQGSKPRRTLVRKVTTGRAMPIVRPLAMAAIGASPIPVHIGDGRLTETTPAVQPFASRTAIHAPRSG